MSGLPSGLATYYQGSWAQEPLGKQGDYSDQVGFGTGTGIPAVIGSRVLMGTGMVLVFGTLWHTMYPHRGITGISRVYYNINIIVLKLFS